MLFTLPFQGESFIISKHELYPTPEFLQVAVNLSFVFGTECTTVFMEFETMQTFSLTAGFIGKNTIQHNLTVLRVGKALLQRFFFTSVVSKNIC